MIKDFLGVRDFQFQDFFGYNLAGIFWGIQKKKICGSARESLVLTITYNQLFVFYHLMLSGIFLSLRNLAWDFFGVNFCSKDSFGF